MDIFKPFPVRQVFLLLDPPGVQVSSETPGCSKSAGQQDLFVDRARKWPMQVGTA